MTQEERYELAQLRSEMGEGFRELRTLIETRRVEDHQAHAALYSAIAQGDGSMEVRLRWVERVAIVAVALGSVTLALGPGLLDRI